MTEKIIKGRQQLLLTHSFWASMTLNLPLIEDKTIKTACTDGTSIRYNPAFTEALSVSEASCLLAHEVAHVMLTHHLRRAGRDNKKWNVACDYVINPLLVADGFELPKGGLLNDAYKDMNAEQVYNLLPDSDDDNGDGDGDGGSGFGDVEDYPEKNKVSKDEHEAQVQQMVAQAENLAKQQGNMPAGMARIVENILNPQLPWQEILARFISAPVKDDYSWRKPNSRYAHMGMYLPSLYSEKLQKGVYAGDTSISMDKKEIAEEVAEITSVCDLYNQDMTVIWCDSKVAGVEEIEAFGDRQINPVGGGGTDFAPVFDYVEENEINPAWLVYHTDGECNSYPAVEPEYPVIWICTGENFNPPFGEVIYKNS